jgi:hypothetical protein
MEPKQSVNNWPTRDEIREAILSDPFVVAGYTCPKVVRDFCAQNYGSSFRGMLEDLDLEHVVEVRKGWSRAKHEEEKRGWIGRQILDAQRADCNTISTMRKNPRYLLLARRILRYFSSFEDARVKSGVNDIFEERNKTLVRRKQTLRIREHQLRLRRGIEKRAVAGERVSVADKRFKADYAAYKALLGAGPEGIKAVRYELRRIFRIYGSAVFCPTQLRKILPDGSDKGKLTQALMTILDAARKQYGGHGSAVDFEMLRVNPKEVGKCEGDSSLVCS